MIVKGPPRKRLKTKKTTDEMQSRGQEVSVQKSAD